MASDSIFSAFALPVLLSLSAAAAGSWLTMPRQAEGNHWLWGAIYLGSAFCNTLLSRIVLDIAPTGAGMFCSVLFGAVLPTLFKRRLAGSSHQSRDEGEFAMQGLVGIFVSASAASVLVWLSSAGTLALLPNVVALVVCLVPLCVGLAVWRSAQLTGNRGQSAPLPFAQPDLRRQAAWAAKRRGLSCTSRPKRLPVACRLAQTLGLAGQLTRAPTAPDRTMTDDHPEYSISEFVLCGFFLGGAICFFIYAGHSLFEDRRCDALEGAGLGLLLLDGSTDPQKYIIDCVTFPVTFIQSSGRDTSLTILAALLGTALWLAGLAGNWLL